MKQLHLYVSGRVQGVGFRYWTKRNARKLELKGWVKNNSDGRVEALVQGEKSQVDRLLKKLAVGPFTAEVKSIEASWEEITETFEGFEILR